ncbi:MAG: hypothetical protein Q9205_007868 [Flavoplaca limonia]
MRLIDTRTYEIREIRPGDKPTYAILSHTWGNDEYVFGDRHDPDRRNSAGFKKISSCCALAASQGYEHLWVDTCCIDKTSSAELTESINSMYRWYEEAYICYVYLSDFVLEQAQRGVGIKYRSSRWFTRGWTLQELLAPEDVVFYDAKWNEIGSKTFLKDTLSQTCRISVRHLSQPKEASVATKMSWASTRQTTRKEDTAYCLLGLFGVNMSLIYGEGANAFFRLQCEIIQSSDDESIFAWRERPDVPDVVAYSGLLAAGPWCFEESGGIVPMRFKNFARPPYFLTNQGLSIEVNTFRGGIRPKCPDDFDASLSVNSDSRMDGRRQGRARIIRTVLACARESNKKAPVTLTLGIIDGRLASRVSCETLEFDSDAIQASNIGFIILQNSRQVCIVGQQRGFKSRVSPIPAAHFNLPFTSRIVLTPAFENVFIVEKYTSKCLTTVEDGSVLVDHRKRARPSDRTRLHFSSLGYRFSLEWDQSQHFHPLQCYVSFSDIGAATNHPVSLGMMSEPVQERPSRKTIGIGDSLSTAIDDKLFLWISTKRTPDSSWQCSVVLDVTPIDRSRLLLSVD